MSRKKVVSAANTAQVNPRTVVHSVTVVPVPPMDTDVKKRFQASQPGKYRRPSLARFMPPTYGEARGPGLGRWFRRY